jgi:hypothetical protein
MTVSSDRRENPRVRVRFPTKLDKVGLTHPIEAVTENVSQGGAYIKTKDWSALEPKETALTTFFLPPGFTGQEEIIALRGEVLINRIDPKREGIGLQFVKTLRQFERV